MSKETKVLQMTDPYAKGAGYFTIGGLHVGTTFWPTAPFIDPLIVLNGREVVIRQHKDQPCCIEVFVRDA